MPEPKVSTIQKNSLLLRIPAQIISYVFHPLFLPTYLFIFLIRWVPFDFPNITDWILKMWVFSVFWFTAFFPAFAVFLLWRLKFSENIYLRTQKERIVPYVIIMFFYWWMYYLSRNFTDQPAVLKFFYMGIMLASVFGLILNNYYKISMHAMGMGGIVAAVILFSFYYRIPMGIQISAVLFIAGTVCTSRFLVSDHTNKEIYAGLFVGILSQLIAYIFVM